MRCWLIGALAATAIAGACAMATMREAAPQKSTEPGSGAVEPTPSATESAPPAADSLADEGGEVVGEIAAPADSEGGGEVPAGRQRIEYDERLIKGEEAPATGAEQPAADRKAVFDFDDDIIEGELATPDGEYLEARKKPAHGSLVKVPDGFGRDRKDWQGGTLGTDASKKLKKAPRATRAKRATTGRGKSGGKQTRAHARRYSDLELRQQVAASVSQVDELWVVSRQPAAVPRTELARPDSGGIEARLPGTAQRVPLPLKHTEVAAQIAGHIASVRVKQQYHNPYADKIEAVYVFPLPEDAAVSEFLMTIGDRTIRGIVRERQEAERIYAEARQQGYVASLMTEERPNVFTQQVANIEPGKAIDVDLVYFNALPLEDGWYVFSFPLVVGPRFNPPGTGDGVGAVARGQRGASGQATEVQYLAPDERSGHDIGIGIDLDAGMPIAALQCATHKIEIQEISASRRAVNLAAADTIPNRDFVLRYRLAGDRIASAFLTHRDERGRSFTLLLEPPAELKQVERSPREMVFVLDCSGSMSGRPLLQAKAAVRRVLELMEPDDTFQIINFSNSASQLGRRPLVATRRNIERGLRYLGSLRAEGGTMMTEGIKAALDFPHQPGKVRIVSFMTDGYIGNETDILRLVHARLGASRLFSFGVGSSPNRYLLDAMARMGNGAVAYLEPDDDVANEAVDAFFERIAYPALSDIEVDWGGLDVSEVYPSRIPDLHVGRPVLISGRFAGTASAVRVTGYAGGKQLGFEVPVEVDDAARPALGQIWARMKVSDLAQRANWDDDLRGLADKIKQSALEHGLLSRFTAFVAVDSSRVTAGDHGFSVTQPVPVPDGVRYENTVGNERR
ncbi:MAG: VWA domain-containing protein [Deltaproteobacteria bacterium]|nr:VWA domain-containing protein [Deltaproteobacteria bacterium]